MAVAAKSQTDLIENEILLSSDEGRNLVIAAIENTPEPNAALKGLFKKLSIQK